MLKGVITKGIGGFYYVDTGDKVYECRARGRFRKESITPLIGDIVEIEVDDTNNQGYIINIFSRKNYMIRPTVANTDQAVIVFAAAKPEVNMKLLQKLLIYTEYLKMDVAICINKIDLDAAGGYKEIVEMLESIPYKVVEASSVLNVGIDILTELLKDKVSVFAGPSGVGKSSILNTIQPGLSLKTGDLSKKISRGTHTTRHAELIKLDFGGMVLDTPGFSSLDLLKIEPSELQEYFPEFHRHQGCRFTGCIHLNEPDCGVKEAVEQGVISQIRYDYYKTFLQELMANRRYK